MIGSGTYGNIYNCLHLPSQTPCIAKAFKEKTSNTMEHIFREIQILQQVCNGPNIIKLYDVIHNNVNRTSDLPVLIFEYVNFTNYRALLPVMSENDMRYYMKKALTALEFIHNNNIVHRDIKHNNILIDEQKRIVRVIDFGMSKWQYTAAQHSTKATIVFKAPELLLQYPQYSYSADIWAFGCFLASFYYNEVFVFHGATNLQVLESQARVSTSNDIIYM